MKKRIFNYGYKFEQKKPDELLIFPKLIKPKIVNL